MNIYLYKNDEQFGPYTIGQVQALVVDGSYTPLDSAWFEGCDDWTTISHVPGILVPEQVRQEPVMPPVEAYSGDQPYVFISYAHKDSAVVYEEIQRLHDANYRIWYDEGIEVSNEWPEEIAQAVIRCAVFLVYISPRSAASVNCRNEINMALNKGKPFLSIYLEETELPAGLELRMGDLQAVLKFRMLEAIYRKKVFAGLEKLLGMGGRATSEVNEPAAETPSVKEENDYLATPVAPDGNPRSEESGFQLSKIPGKWLWATIGAIVVLSLVLFFFPSGEKAGKDGSEIIALPRGQSPPAGYSLYQRGESKPLQWQELASVLAPREVFDGVEALNGKIYVVGGKASGSRTNLVESYDPISNKWKTLDRMSVDREGVATAVLDDKLYAIGGIGRSSVEIFDPQTGRWSSGPSLPGVLSHAIAINVGRKILLVGGRKPPAYRDVTNVLELNPDNNRWELKAPMPTARYGQRLALLGNEVWSIGGSASNQIEIYDLSKNSWRDGPSLTKTRSWPVVWVSNGRIYVGGGWEEKSIEVYDPSTLKWKENGAFPEKKWLADAAVLGDKVYVVAGSDSSKVFSTTIGPPKDLYIRDSAKK